MSADTMPCGCLGHADHEALCRYPALEVERDGLRARVEQAERGRDDARHDRDLLDAQWRSASDVAERNAQEAFALLREVDEWKATASAATAARDRAVADNARERDAHAMTATGWEKEALEWREKRAALLEYVRALEAVLPLAMHDEACQSDVSGTRDPDNCALCSANAMKGTR